MVIDYFNSCVPARSLGIAAQIKIIWYFAGLWFCIFFRLPPGKYKIQDCVMKEERF
jgi:hypothetical protein